MFSYVYLLAGYLQKLLMDLYETLWTAWSQGKEELNFCTDCPKGGAGMGVTSGQKAYNS